MLDLGTLRAHINLDGADEFNKDLKEASDSAEKTSKTFKQQLVESCGKLAVGFTSLASAAKDLWGDLKGLLDKTASYGDEVDKASQKMGISAEEYQK